MATNTSDASVEIKYDDTVDPPRLVLSPPSALIRGPGKATWTAINCNVTIAFDNEGGSQGPFPCKHTPDNPSVGVYNCPSCDVTSAPAGENTNGTWHYTVTLNSTDKATPIYGDVVVTDRP